MTKPELYKVVWIINEIYDAGKISFKELDRKWVLDQVDYDNPMSKRTFHEWQRVAWDVFHIDIENERRGDYRYFISNPSEFDRNIVDHWLIKH